MVELFKGNAEPIRTKWVELVMRRELFKEMTPEDLDKESATVYNICIQCFESGKFDQAEEYAHTRASSGIVRGMTVGGFIRSLLILRDEFDHTLYQKYGSEGRYEETLPLFEPVINDMLSRCVLVFSKEVDVTTRKPLEASSEMLNEWIFALEKLTQTPNGLRWYREIEADAARGWFTRNLPAKFKPTRTAYDACVQYRELADSTGLLTKEQLILEEKGRNVQGTFLQPCPYVKACIWTREGGMNLVCLRATPFIMAIELIAKKTYKSQLASFDPEKACVVLGLPAEKEFEVVASAVLGEGSLRVNPVDARDLGVDFVDNVVVNVVREESRARLNLMAFTSSTVPAGMVVMNPIDVRRLELKKQETVSLRRTGSTSRAKGEA